MYLLVERLSKPQPCLHFDQIILCWGAGVGCPEQFRRFSSIPDLYPLDVSSDPPPGMLIKKLSMH